MSDVWGPDGSDDNQAGGTPPPPPPPPTPPATPLPIPPPPAPPVTPPVMTLQTETEVSTGRTGLGGKLAAGAAGLLLLGGGTAFALANAGSDGPGTAEAAVADLLDAASNEDVLGLMGALDPGERDSLRGPIESMFGELTRLEILDDDFELGSVSGFDFEFEDVTYRTEPVRDGLARVYLTGGTVTSGINSDDIPVGDFVDDALERFGGSVEGFSETDTSDIADAEVFLVARDTSDGWRVSIGYTIAEQARIDSGQPVPTDGIEAIGADSPEDAVSGMVDAVVSLDPAEMIARLSPGEFGALQEYAPLFLGDLDALEGGLPPGVDVEVNDLDLRSDTSGNTATVFVDGFDVSIAADGAEYGITYADGCVELSGDVDELTADAEDAGFPLDLTEPICADDLEELSSGAGFGAPIPQFPTVDPAAVGITTTRVDGAWYVAPIATGLDGIVASLEVLERETLDDIVDGIEEFFTGFQEGFGFDEDDFFDEDFDDFADDFSDDDFSDDFSEDDFSDGATLDPEDRAVLTELVSTLVASPAEVDCVIAELEAGEIFIAWDLADAYSFDFEPDAESQAALDSAIATCT